MQWQWQTEWYLFYLADGSFTSLIFFLFQAADNSHVMCDDINSEIKRGAFSTVYVFASLGSYSLITKTKRQTADMRLRMPYQWKESLKEWSFLTRTLDELLNSSGPDKRGARKYRPSLMIVGTEPFRQSLTIWLILGVFDNRLMLPHYCSLMNHGNVFLRMFWKRADSHSFEMSKHSEARCYI